MVDGQLNKVAFIIQARMLSSRLPGKVLLPIPIDQDRPLLISLIDSLKKSSLDPYIIVATSIKGENDQIAKICEYNKIPCYRGSEEDVLSRFLNICKNVNIDTIVRFTADNPMIDIEILDNAVIQHIKSGKDYSITCGLPLGMNLEVVSCESLMKLEYEELTKEDREHVTLFLRNSKRYNTQYIQLFDKSTYTDVRVTVDYPNDFLVVSTLFSIAYANNIKLGIPIIDYCKEKYNWIFQINCSNIQR